MFRPRTLLDAGDGARGQVAQHRRPVIRRPVREVTVTVSPAPSPPSSPPLARRRAARIDDGERA